MIIVSNQGYRCFKFGKKKTIAGSETGKQFL